MTQVCSACLKEIDSRAQVCPYCTTRVDPESSRDLAWAAEILLALVGLVLLVQWVRDRGLKGLIDLFL